MSHICRDATTDVHFRPCFFGFVFKTLVAMGWFRAESYLSTDRRTPKPQLSASDAQIRSFEYLPVADWLGISGDWFWTFTDQIAPAGFIVTGVDN